MTITINSVPAPSAPSAPSAPAAPAAPAAPSAPAVPAVPVQLQFPASAQAATTTDVRTAALQFLSWAREHGLLAADAYRPHETLPNPEFDHATLDPGVFSALRTRQVRFLAVASQKNHISVFLKKAAPNSKELKILPRTCNGHTLSYHQGNTESVSPTAVAESTNNCSMHQHETKDFYTCGSSISVGNNREAGTLGCLVRNARSELFGLSNNHVSGACSYAPIGLPVLAPGILDVGPGNPFPFTIGLHETQLPMQFGDPSGVDHTQNSDAALIKITSPNLISSMQRNFYDTPASVIDLQPGMQVEKVGRTTGHTHGIVLGELIGAVLINYVAAQYGFSGGAYFEGVFVVHGVGDVFSDGGDSGSLVTHVDANGIRHAVGIVFAGCIDNSAPGNKRALILPLRPILNRFNVTLLSQHNC